MAAKAPNSRSKRVVELRPSSVKEWHLPGFDDPFVQDPLTFFEKNEFFGLVARAIETAISSGADINGILALIGMDDKDLEKIKKGEIDFTMLPAATGVTSILARVFSMAPDLLQEAYLIALSVPRERWHEVRPALVQIDDDTGFGIMESFIEQNTSTIRDFLSRWLDLVKGTIQAQTETTEEPPPVA